MQTRADLRNVAIVAHVDHGKTTLVDQMLWQSGAFREHQDVAERVMDSMDLEREKGITILAKNTAVRYGDVKVNIVDTPGHADFGGEVERGLSMVDGVLLLVDASEGPLPQTRFVLRKALEARLPVVLVVNKVDRPDARIAEVVARGRGAVPRPRRRPRPARLPHRVLRRPRGPGLARPARPTVPACPRGLAQAAARPAGRRTSRRPPTTPTCRSRRWSPTSTPRPTWAAWRCAASAAACCARAPTSPGAGPTAASSGPSSPSCTSPTRSTGCPPTEAGPGEIVAIAGIPDITIGETLADPDDPRPLPVITIDEPSLSMTIGINTAPLSGREGTSLTARLVKSRLDQELVGNVSIRVLPTERPDTWEVQGRGELQLAVLVEMMRREGFELTVGKPQVLTREIDGKLHEPVDRVTVDVPEEYLGVVTQLLALRKGRMVQITNHGTGWVRLEHLVPARGLVGFRTELMTETRGTGAAPPRVRAHGAVGGRDPPPAQRLAGGRPQRRDHRATRCSTCRTGASCSSGPASRCTRAWSSARTPGPTTWTSTPPGEEAHQRPGGGGRQLREADPAPAAVAGAGPGAHRRRRVRRGHAPLGPAAQGRPSTRRSGPAPPSAPRRDRPAAPGTTGPSRRLPTRTAVIACVQCGIGRSRLLVSWSGELWAIGGSAMRGSGDGSTAPRTGRSRATPPWSCWWPPSSAWSRSCPRGSRTDVVASGGGEAVEVSEAQPATGWGTSVTACPDRQLQVPDMPYSPPCYRLRQATTAASHHRRRHRRHRSGSPTA